MFEDAPSTNNCLLHGHGFWRQMHQVACETWLKSSMFHHIPKDRHVNVWIPIVPPGLKVIRILHSEDLGMIRFLHLKRCASWTAQARKVLVNVVGWPMMEFGPSYAQRIVELRKDSSFPKQVFTKSRQVHIWHWFWLKMLKRHPRVNSELANWEVHPLWNI